MGGQGPARTGVARGRGNLLRSTEQVVHVHDACTDFKESVLPSMGDMDMDMDLQDHDDGSEPTD